MLITPVCVRPSVKATLIAASVFAFALGPLAHSVATADEMTVAEQNSPAAENDSAGSIIVRPRVVTMAPIPNPPSSGVYSGADDTVRGLDPHEDAIIVDNGLGKETSGSFTMTPIADPPTRAFKSRKSVEGPAGRVVQSAKRADHRLRAANAIELAEPLARVAKSKRRGSASKTQTRRFKKVASTPAIHRGEMHCLATAIYFEARNQSINGQKAVAEVVLARTRTPGRPKSVCGVVYEGSKRKTGCQFSFTCDGLSDVARPGEAWTRARDIAEAMLRTGGKSKPVSRGATFYHADYVSPGWATRMVKLVKIGTHIFYRPKRGHLL